jgi:DNA-directed RNA polymerase specialized sigma subunit
MGKPYKPKTWTEVKEELFQEDPEFQAYWDETEPFAKISSEMIRLRCEQDLTQRELAERLGTSVSAVSRMESFRYRGMKLETILKVAKALGMRLNIEFLEAS